MALARSERAVVEPDRRQRLAIAGWSAAGLVIPVVVLGAVYLAPFIAQSVPTPFGFDTSKYMWRTELVAERGLDALRGAAPPGLNTNPDRPAYPTVAAQVSAATGISELRWALILPAVAAAGIGLAAGAFALTSLREPIWSFAAYAIAVGASFQVARTAVGYADNLVILSICLAVAAAALRGARGGVLLPGVVLLVAAAVTHWQFATVFAGVLLATAVILAPESIRMRRGGDPLTTTPATRLTMTVGAAAAASVAAFAIGRIWPVTFPDPGRGTVDRKLSLFLGGSHIRFVVPIAIAGIPALLWPRDRTRRYGLALVVVWASVGLIGYLGFHLLALDLPAHRLVLFSIGIPLLGAAALVGIVRAAARPGSRVVTVVAVVGAATLLAFLASTTSNRWEDNGRSFAPEQLAQVAAAGRYLERAGTTGPAVFVVEGRSLARQDHIIRAGLPAWAIPRTFLYLGDPANLLEGRPTLTGDRKADRGSIESWAHIESFFDDATTVLQLTTFQRREHPTLEGTEVGPGIQVLQGPRMPGAPVMLSRPEGAEPMALVGSAIGVLLLIGAAGSGWSTWAGGGGMLVRAGFSPAFGFAALVLAGLLVDRLGFHLGGPPGIATLVSVGVLGWVPVVLRRRSMRSADPAVT
jgi:hypothetical protein